MRMRRQDMGDYQFDDGWSMSPFHNPSICFFGSSHSKTTSNAGQTVTLPNSIAQAQAGMAQSVAPQPTFGSYGWSGQDPFAAGMQLAQGRASTPSPLISSMLASRPQQSYFGGGQQSPGSIFAGLPQTIQYQGAAPAPAPSTGSGSSLSSILGDVGSIAGMILPFL